MHATLDLTASLHGWMCSNCHQLYDSMWRPIPHNKAWAPPINISWPVDKPTFNYCSNCGACFMEESPNGEEIRTS